jgi:hypothetical protein
MARALVPLDGGGCYGGSKAGRRIAPRNSCCGDSLFKLFKEFARFNERVRKLAANIKQTHEDVVQLQIASEKVARQFSRIKKP